MSISRSAHVSARFPSLSSALLVSFLAVGGVLVSVLAVAASDEHQVEILIKDHKFDPPALKLPIGKPIKISVKNLDASPEEFESHDLGFEKVIAGNSSAIIRVRPLKPGTYIFFGEYHQDTALGHIVAE
jgi:hypothetical protein